MAKITTSDFGAIHDALNKMIIGEVKAALRLVPGKRITWDGQTPLCHIILSTNEAYIPREVEVLGASIGSPTWSEYDGLVIHGRNADNESSTGILWYEDDTDWLDITDFQYLIEQLKDLMPDGEHDLTNGADLHELDRKAHDKLNY